MCHSRLYSPVTNQFTLPPPPFHASPDIVRIGSVPAAGTSADYLDSSLRRIIIKSTTFLTAVENPRRELRRRKYNTRKSQRAS
jgi:hypothetical protein